MGKEVKSVLERTFEFSEKEFLEKLGLVGRFSKFKSELGENKKIEIVVVEKVSVGEVVDDKSNIQNS